MKVGPFNISLSEAINNETSKPSSYKFPVVGKMSAACAGRDGKTQKHGQCYMLGCSCTCHKRKQ